MILTTDRLTLREPDDPDADALRAFYRRNAERFARWEPVPDDDPGTHRARIAAARAARRAGKPTTFVAFERASGVLAGVVELNGFSEENGGSAMLSYRIDAAFEGRGYAREAVRAVIDFSAQQLGLRTLAAYYDPANVRSGNLLERAGFRVVNRTPVIPGFERLMRAQNMVLLTL